MVQLLYVHLLRLFFIIHIAKSLLLLIHDVFIENNHAMYFEVGSMHLQD